MKTKEEMEEFYGLNLLTDNDGEVFLHHMNSGGDPVEFFEEHDCSFAGLWYDESEIYALRNRKRPLWYHKPDTDTIMFASTRDIFDRALNVIPTSCTAMTTYKLSGML